jgi:hypothetical protein
MDTAMKPLTEEHNQKKTDDEMKKTTSMGLRGGHAGPGTWRRWPSPPGTAAPSITVSPPKSITVGVDPHVIQGDRTGWVLGQICEGF